MSNEKKLPDWDTNNYWAKAPEWAMWRAKDKDGHVFYYSSKPIQKELNWDSIHGSSCEYGYRIFDAIDWRESLERRPEPQTDNEQPQINQPVNDEWFISMGFQFHKKSETFIIPAMRGGYNYDIEVNAQFIALRDIEKESVTVLHDTMYHGAITQEKVLHTLMLFN